MTSAGPGRSDHEEPEQGARTDPTDRRQSCPPDPTDATPTDRGPRHFDTPDAVALAALLDLLYRVPSLDEDTRAAIEQVSRWVNRRLFWLAGRDPVETIRPRNGLL